MYLIFCIFTEDYQTYTFDLEGNGSQPKIRIYSEYGTDIGGKSIYIDFINVEEIPDYSAISSISGRIKVNSITPREYFKDSPSSVTSFNIESWMLEGVDLV